MTDTCMCRHMCSILWHMELATPNAGLDKRSRSLRAHCLTSPLAWRAARLPSASLTQCCYTSEAGEHTFWLYTCTGLMAFPLKSYHQSMAGKAFSISSPILYNRCMRCIFSHAAYLCTFCQAAS